MLENNQNNKSSTKELLSPVTETPDKNLAEQASSTLSIIKRESRNPVQSQLVSNKISFDLADNFLSQLSNIEVQGLDIVLTGINKISFDFLLGDKRWMMEIEADGEFYVAAIDGNKNIIEPVERIEEAVVSYRKFITGDY